ncbi:MAG: hypothetical protein PHS24_03750 [Bacilli bacterium]|nr:hypothetical protein [Bacilli bacterium]
MKKIEFYKNNKKMNIDKNKVFFDQNNLAIIKSELDYKIKLDFMNKKVYFTLNKEKKTFPIEIIEMNYYNHTNKWIFNYELNSEKDVKNVIKIEL